MFDTARRIAALEFAIDYVPGCDGNHSMSVLLEMLEELRRSESASVGRMDVITEEVKGRC